MGNKKQTAVERLVDKIKLKYNDIDFYHIKKEIEAAERWKGTNFAEQYYNETYNK